ncbi:glycosyltransferase family 4 protein [Croceibacterium sp. TMG7-5b_MA50]|uniref:glycosyltransferase family 4 protein n=1 Tax=Croceibacterium sp. TMG7-5b_MA50 TaxID=3121290 RepID=UPI003221E0FA
MTADTVGGVWQYATDLAAALVSRGDRVTIAVMGPSPDATQARNAAEGGCALVDTGLPLDWLADGQQPVVDAAGLIARLAAEADVDLVHCNSPALVGAARWPAPVVAVAHSCIATWWQAARSEPLDPAFDWHRQMTRDGLLAADAVVVPSAGYAAAVQRTYALPALPLVVHNGRAIEAQVRTADTDLAPFALTVGRLWDEVKGAAMLDRVAARIDLPFVAAGSTRAPHGGTITLHHLRHEGALPRSQLDALLQQRPIFVSAASFEPFGLAVLEAAAAGCALVLSDIPTFRELWDGAATFVSPDDEAGFAAAITALAAMPEQRRSLGDAAAERARRYTPDRMAAEMQAIYNRLQTRSVAA